MMEMSSALHLQDQLNEKNKDTNEYGQTRSEWKDAESLLSNLIKETSNGT
jgi:hypothetical protein